MHALPVAFAAAPVADGRSRPPHSHATMTLAPAICYPPAAAR